MNKLKSGRFLLSIITGLTFAYLACKKILPPEATASIITMVFGAYFARKRPEEK